MENKFLIKFLNVLSAIALGLWGFAILAIILIAIMNFKQFTKDIKDISLWAVIIGLPIFAAIMKVLVNNLKK